MAVQWLLPYELLSKCKLMNTGIHYGCGRRLFPNCTNIDARPWSDLVNDVVVKARHFCFLQHDAKDPLPFEDNSIDFVFSEHFIEHVPLSTAIFWLKETFRVLKKGGVARVSTPNLGRFCKSYSENSLPFFEEMRKHLSENLVYVPPRKGWVMNQIFYYWDHRWLYDEEELIYAATRAGFLTSGIHFQEFGVSLEPRLGEWDLAQRKNFTLYVDLQKEG